MKSILLLTLCVLLFSSSYAALMKKNAAPELFPVEIRPASPSSYNARTDSVNLPGAEMHRRIEEREKEETLRNNMIREFNPTSVEEWIDFVSKKNSAMYDQMSFARDVATIQSVSAKLEKYLQEKKKDVEEKTALLDLKIKEQKIIEEELNKLNKDTPKVPEVKEEKKEEPIAKPKKNTVPKVNNGTSGRVGKRTAVKVIKTVITPQIRKIIKKQIRVAIPSNTAVKKSYIVKKLKKQINVQSGKIAQNVAEKVMNVKKDKTKKKIGTKTVKKIVKTAKETAAKKEKNDIKKRNVMKQKIVKNMAKKVLKKINANKKNQLKKMNVTEIKQIINKEMKKEALKQSKQVNTSDKTDPKKLIAKSLKKAVIKDKTQEIAREIKEVIPSKKEKEDKKKKMNKKKKQRFFL